MPGLGPGIHDLLHSVNQGEVQMERASGGWVYIMTNRRDGVLYVGVTSDIARRGWEHRTGVYPGFTRRYGLKHLVHMERFEDIRDAIQREKALKGWPRAWKVRLVQADNPDWNDLYETLA